MDGALWRFCLAVYGRPGVEAACLRLQDRFGLDVPMILFCVWAGYKGPGPLTSDFLRRALVVVQRWGHEITGPLRAARRKLKEEDLGAGEARLELREAVIQAERRSEEITLSLLESLAHQESKDSPGMEAAHANLHAYCASVGCAPDIMLERDLDLVIRAGGLG